MPCRNKADVLNGRHSVSNLVCIEIDTVGCYRTLKLDVNARPKKTRAWPSLRSQISAPPLGKRGKASAS